MENITLGQIAAGIGIITVIVGGYVKLYNMIKDKLGEIVSDALKPLNDSILEINQRLDTVDLESCKNFLVRCIADIERGQSMSETESERFWEQYDYYIRSGHNTYVKNKVEKLKQEGKL